ncbi:hypothetical protein CDAR_455261 [Caerostris darwini]|uniref:Uncharacterized protein n=1 Tax=Caerostris darwini TaxID=1538125 RepID=A0AAV4WUW3_9ARAC|nr:hypothetical protein CDAR_455261 [Caerostris darwini]
MEVLNCEFCKAYVTNFEVHYCSNFGNQHRHSSASLPGSSSSNLVQDNIDSRPALPTNYDAAMGQMNSSMQQSVLPNILRRTDYEATATAARKNK